jgi:transposase InsO family protein
VQCIWRREGLKVPARQTPRGRLWLADGSCVRLRPERANHIWSYDFVSATTHDGRTLRLLTVIDEYTRECLAIQVARRLGHREVLETLADVMLWRGIPEHIRSDNGPEFIARELRAWLATLGARTLNAVHHPRQSAGERLLRELQRQAAGRVLERRDLLFTEGGADRDRTVAGAVQHSPAAFLAGLPAAGAGSLSPRHGSEPHPTVPGGHVDSHSAGYKTSVRSRSSTASRKA